MENNDYSIIKPVEHLQNIGAMTPVDRQADKRRRQNQQKHRRETTGQPGIRDQHDELDSGSGSSEQGSIDYRA